MRTSNTECRFQLWCGLVLALLTQSAHAALEDEFKEILRTEVEMLIPNKELVSNIVEIRFSREFEKWKISRSKDSSFDEIESKKQSKNILPSEPELNFGIRYWYATNNTKFDSRSSDARRGDPSATLDWSNLKSNNIELALKVVPNHQIFFVNSLVGGHVNSISSSGSIRDTDYYVGQSTFADTTSHAKEMSATYFSIDVGRDFKVDEWKLSPFVGYYHSKQMLEASGGTVNPITSGDYSAYNMMGWSVGQTFSNALKPFNYETVVTAPRLGFSGHRKIDSFELVFQFAYMPNASIRLNDYHNLDTSKVTTSGPNGISKGKGSGLSAESLLNYQFSKNGKFGIGFKQEVFTLKNQDMQFNNINLGWVNSSNGLKQLSIKKFGTLFNFQYTY